jgi:hypothetical protein
MTDSAMTHWLGLTRRENFVMALREKLRTKAQPLLNPGETIEQIFPAQGGAHPLLVTSFGLVGLLLMAKWLKFYVVARTDQSLILFGGGASGKPKNVIARLPLDTPIGPVKGIFFAPLTLDDRRVWVHRWFFPDARAASSIGQAA